MLRIQHRINCRLTDGCRIVGPTHRPHFTPQEHYFSISGTHFCSRLSEPQGLVRPEGLGKLKTCIHLIGSRTSDAFLKFNCTALSSCLTFSPEDGNRSSFRNVVFFYLEFRTMDRSRKPVLLRVILHRKNPWVYTRSFQFISPKISFNIIHLPKTYLSCGRFSFGFLSTKFIYAFLSPHRCSPHGHVFFDDRHTLVEGNITLDIFWSTIINDPQYFNSGAVLVILSYTTPMRWIFKFT
jgi:hypothetical protein